jgi:DNA modification methylase
MNSPTHIENSNCGGFPANTISSAVSSECSLDYKSASEKVHSADIIASDILRGTSVNYLYCGDNLHILRDYIQPDSVDLVYLDPPFKSDQNYNFLFREKDGSKSKSQIQAFTDTWEWNLESHRNYMAVVEKGGKISEALTLLRTFVGESDMLAYLAMMAPRLDELKRVLKPSGFIYLHCDPTASHYLKVLMDAIFGPSNFQNEIIWKRTTTKNDYVQGAKNWPRIHDVLLCYSKDSTEARFYQPFAMLDEKYIQSHYRLVDENGRHYQLDNLTAPGAGTRGHPRYEFMGVTRYWRYNQDKMEKLAAEGRVIQPRPGAVPRYKRYLDETKGVAVGDMWADISPVNSQAKERIGYPTQKPEALLNRMMEACTKEGDIVLDPFCGCGTAIEASKHAKRRWIGIDITRLAIGVVRKRLEKIGEYNGKTYKTIWEPLDLSGAEALALDDPFQFQDWVIRRLAGQISPQRSGDRGIDGILYFKDEPTSPLQKIIVSVKSGHTGPAHVRELHGTVNRERAAMGILVTLREPTKAMLRDAASCGVHRGLAGTYAKTQVVTVQQILDGKHHAMIPVLQRISGERRPVSSMGGQLELPGMAL